MRDNDPYLLRLLEQGKNPVALAHGNCARDCHVVDAFMVQPAGYALHGMDIRDKHNHLVRRVADRFNQRIQPCLIVKMDNLPWRANCKS